MGLPWHCWSGWEHEHHDDIDVAFDDYDDDHHRTKEDIPQVDQLYQQGEAKVKDKLQAMINYDDDEQTLQTDDDDNEADEDDDDLTLQASDLWVSFSVSSLVQKLTTLRSFDKCG